MSSSFGDSFSENDFNESRVEALAKVTGKGKYSAEYQLPDLAYGVLVGSSIASGIIKSINTDKVKNASGVIEIFSYFNKPDIPSLQTEQTSKAAGAGLNLFYGNKIYYSEQPIALVVAETLEEAVFAASLITAEYDEEPFEVNFDEKYKTIPLKPDGKDRGSMDEVNNASHIFNGEYTIKNEVHNAMEMHATIAHWKNDDQLTLYDKTQGVNRVQGTISKVFAIPSKNIHVVSEFVGGGFGSGLRVWSNTLAATMAAKKLKRPVKVMLTRPQMFALVGYRPQCWQRITIAADNDGKFTGAHHQAKWTTSAFENYGEGITRASRLIYDFKNLKTESAVVPLNLGTPTWMRGPGDASGAFALECAIDELSYSLKMDPVTLRLLNVSSRNPENGLPWSTNFIAECIQQSAAKIGWDNRKPTPGMLEENGWNVGYGMGIGLWTTGQSDTSAAAILDKNGILLLQTAMTDIGTGTGTGMRNIAMQQTGISSDKIKVELGDSILPPAPTQGGSRGFASMSIAIVSACNALKLKLAAYAAKINSAFDNAKAEEISLAHNGIALKSDKNSFIAFGKIWDAQSLTQVRVEERAQSDENKNFSYCSAAAHFCRVKVHSSTAKVRVDKIVAIADGGKIVNTKAAANQLSGAAVGGIGMALMEEQLVDSKYGRLVGNDLAGYHFAVNADAPIIEVGFINKPDFNLNSTGAKGLGEVGIIGSAAAIANAIYNATGKRVRGLPITPDKLL